MAAPYWIARTQLDLADLLVARNPDEVRALASEALSHAAVHGYAALAARAEALRAHP